MNDAVNLVAEQVGSAGERVEGATVAAEAALAALESSFDEWVTLQKALQILTRRTSAPFVPNIPDTHPLITLLEEWNARLGLNGAKQAERGANPREKAAPPPSIPSKVGIIYDAAMSLQLEKFKSEDIYKAIPADAPLPITRDDVSRNVSKLIYKGKLWRDREGYLHKGAQPQNGDAPGSSVHIGEREEQSDVLPLAG